MGARIEALAAVGDFVPEAKEIEDLLDDEARDIISSELGTSGNLTKKQINQFFQEHLARRVFKPLGKNFEKRAKALLNGLEERMQAL